MLIFATERGFVIFALNAIVSSVLSDKPNSAQFDYKGLQMKFNRHIAPTLALVCAVAASSASAATYSATTVIAGETSYGTCSNPVAARCDSNDRRVVENALGATDSKFYSLGLGGRLTLGFDRAVFAPGASLILEEVTFGGAQSSRHFEAVDVYSVLGSVATFVQTVYNSTTSTTLRIADRFEYIRLVDVTLREFASTTSFDGFDVNSVKATIAPVPLPAGAAFLLAGLGGLATMRRRKAAGR